MLSVLTFKWQSDPRFRSQFTSKHVNILCSMIRRHLTIPFEFFCITDDPVGLKAGIRYFPLWENPVINWGPRKPNCFRRLRIYSSEAKKWFGERILSLDLDIVILKNINSLVERKEDFVAWNKGGTRYQGTMILHKTGTRKQLWEDFDSATTPDLIRMNKKVGSDQAWVSMKLSANEAVWTPEKDGIYSYKVHVRNKTLPKDAKIIVFHGNPKPSEVMGLKWVKENYR